jgi:AbrB family looped-hinge helix DNA binding protein
MFSKMKLWGSATVGSKGQVVIPAEAREDLQIKEGDKLVVLSHPMRKGVVLMKADAIEEMLEHVQAELTQVQQSTDKTLRSNA